MKSLLTTIRGLAVLVLGFGVVFLVNLPHDFILNSLRAGSAKNYVPLTAQAEIVSSGLAFLAGVVAAFVVYLVGGRHRVVLLGVLTALFLLVDLTGVLGSLATTSLPYRVALVALVPLEVWVGYLLGKRLRPATNLSA